MGAIYTQLSMQERRRIEDWWHAKVPVAEMARVLKRHKPTIFREIKLPFTPTSASCLNMVERFFVEITSKRVRCWSYSIVDDLETAICNYLVQYKASQNPSPGPGPPKTFR